MSANTIKKFRYSVLFGLLLACLPTHAASYVFPGNLPASCSLTRTGNYLCSAAVTLAANDTVALSGPSTITINGAFATGANARINAAGSASNLTLNVNGPVKLGATNSVNGSITTISGNIDVGNSSTVIGALTTRVAGAITVGKNATITGDVATTTLGAGAGAITIGDNASVIGGVSTNIGKITIGNSSSVSLNILAYDGIIEVGNGSQVGGSICTDKRDNISVGNNTDVGGNVETAHVGAIQIGSADKILGAVNIRGAGTKTVAKNADVGNARIGAACALSPDSDGDGVPDNVDEFPTDGTRASSAWYPGSASYGTLAYEDLWPVLGDYDLNDIVVRYRSRQILNAQKQVKALEMDLNLAARGGFTQSGFALVLPGIAAGNIASTSLTQDGAIVTTRAVLVPNATGENGGAVFEIFPNAQLLIAGDYSCALKGYSNTAQDCSIENSVDFKLTVELKVASATFPPAPYDPFIFNTAATDRKFPTIVTGAKAIEVHLAGKQPTSRADKTLMGSNNDGSVLGNGKYGNSYRSKINGLPWALDLPTVWDYPVERLDTYKAYTGVAAWAASGGTVNADWYLKPLSNAQTFRNGR